MRFIPQHKNMADARVTISSGVQSNWLLPIPMYSTQLCMVCDVDALGGRTGICRESVPSILIPRICLTSFTIAGKWLGHGLIRLLFVATGR
jgi:hypothetical protein